MTQKNQKGSGLIMLLLTAGLLVVIGVAGYYVWNKQHSQTEALTQNATNASSYDTGRPQPTHYMVITEWGIKIPLSADFAYHSLAATSDSFGGMVITDSQLAALVKKVQCATEQSIRSGQVDLMIRETTIQDGPAMWSRKINGYYYGIPDTGGSGGSVCSNNTFPGNAGSLDIPDKKLAIDKAALQAALNNIIAQ